MGTILAPEGKLWRMSPHVSLKLLRNVSLKCAESAATQRKDFSAVVGGSWQDFDDDRVVQLNVARLEVLREVGALGSREVANVAAHRQCVRLNVDFQLGVAAAGKGVWLADDEWSLVDDCRVRVGLRLLATSFLV